MKFFFSKVVARVHLANQEELGWFTGEKGPDIVADILEAPRMGHTILYDVAVISTSIPPSSSTASNHEQQRQRRKQRNGECICGTLSDQNNAHLCRWDLIALGDGECPQRQKSKTTLPKWRTKRDQPKWFSAIG